MPRLWAIVESAIVSVPRSLQMPAPTASLVFAPPALFQATTLCASVSVPWLSIPAPFASPYEHGPSGHAGASVSPESRVRISAGVAGCR